MSNVTITCARRDKDWDILGIWATGWYHPKSSVISNIENNIYAYYVNWITKVIVKQGVYAKYITTVPDNTTWNNLDNIKLCSL